MTGNRRRGVVLQNRDRHLLAELAVMRIIDRDMAKVVASFQSTRRANARLLQLNRAGVLRRFFVGTIGAGRKAVYTLSRKGTELAGVQLGGVNRPEGKLVTGDRFVEHQTAINEVYLAAKYPLLANRNAHLASWHVLRESISEAIKLTPDGYFEILSAQGVRPVFLEVDLATEALSVWKQKITYYLQLAVSGEFTKRFRQPQFRVLVVANSERRLANIRSVVAKSTDKIFWFATLDSIKREGIWSPIWLRPTGDQRHPLL